MSRRRDFEIMFGSDSFLDVVANIVGILIILIVIAGVRVSQAPPVVRTSAVQDLPLPEELKPETAVPEQSDAAEPVDVPRLPESEPDTPLEPLPPLAPPPELLTQVRQMESEIAALSLETKKLGDSLAGANRQKGDLEDRLKTARQLMDDRKSEMTVSAERDANRKHDLELTRQAAARLLAQVTELEKKSAPVEKLQHRITPVSRTVMGREMHFRLEKNRVAEVPIDALVERLKEHIERRQEWIVKMRQHKGQVGPIGGFNLEYIIGVDMISAIGEYRMSMKYWEVHPEPSLRGETAEVALSQGSKFYDALLNAGSDTTLTFWVYPDSYALFRKLQAFAHEQGFPVAGRPLPEGVPIQGSPNGTRSASQ